jgi:hypothetical protein
VREIYALIMMVVAAIICFGAAYLIAEGISLLL